MSEVKKKKLTPHQEKALNFKTHIALTANAGSGKTFVLSRRFVEIITKTKTDLRSIAAITFTEKAASELYHKISNAIEERIQESNDDNELRFLEKTRGELISANISTIHSFCIDILKEYPVEAGIDANFKPIDETRSSELIEQSVDEVLKDFLSQEENIEDLKYLIRVFGSQFMLKQTLTSLINNRKNVLLAKEKLYKDSNDKICESYDEIFWKNFTIIYENNKSEFLDSAERINDRVLEDKPGNEIAGEVKELIDNLPNSSEPIEINRLICRLKETLLTKSGNSVKIRGYLSREAASELQEEILFAENYLCDLSDLEVFNDSNEITHHLVGFSKKLLELFEMVLASYTKRKYEDGYLDYEDILIITKELLNNEKIQNELSDRFSFLMVDEYQDTNEIQYQIFLPILAELTRGKLFIVGDEKQSIYMFRDADIELFEKTREMIREKAGEKTLLSLPDSFRMLPQLSLFTNTLFKKLFNKPNPLFNEVGHSELICARKTAKEGKIEILAAKEEENKNENLFTEAELVAKRIIKLLNEDKDLSFNDIVVLTRKRKFFDEIEPALIHFKIPYSIVGGKGFYQTQLVSDVFNYFSFLLNQNNSAALAGILRSPFFTVKDSTLYEISLENDFGFWNKLISYSEKSDEATRIVSLLKSHIIFAKNNTAEQTLNKLVTDTGYVSVLSARENYQQEISNLDKLIQKSIEFSNDGFRSLYDFVEYLSNAITAYDDEAQAAVVEESNTIKLMTIHQAKGLEFPAVFIYGCHDKPQTSKVASKSVLVDKNFGFITKLPIGNNFLEDYQAAPIVNLYDYFQEKKEAAENKRVFYVAVTRAENYLFLSLTAEEENSYKTGSFAELIQRGLGIDLSSDNYKLEGKVKLLDENNKPVERMIELDIPVISELENIELLSKPDDSLPVKIKNLSGELISSERMEIISASKAREYVNCPLKYHLLFNIGLIDLVEFNEFTPLDIRDEVIERDEEGIHFSGLSADIKGNLIHEILDKNIQLQELKNYLNEKLGNKNKTFKENVFNDLNSDLGEFYESETWKKLNEHKDFINEYEVYHKLNDFYLHGIVDKLVIEDDLITIVDYKTDNISESQIDKRAEKYKFQLKFYLYIVSHLFPGIQKFRLLLIFIKHPDKYIEWNFNSNDLPLIEEAIIKIVSGIRNGEYHLEKEHCEQCIFSDDLNNCIKV